MVVVRYGLLVSKVYKEMWCHAWILVPCMNEAQNSSSHNPPDPLIACSCLVNMNSSHTELQTSHICDPKTTNLTTFSYTKDRSF